MTHHRPVTSANQNGITADTYDRACEAVANAMSGCSLRTAENVQKWIAKNTGFFDLQDMMCSVIQHNYTPTIRAASETLKAYKEAELVANAFDAACTWACPMGSVVQAYRPDSACKFNRAGRGY